MAEQQPTGVPSVVRLLDIVEFFAESRRPATLSTIASTLGVPKSSCLAILETLVKRGYLYEIAPRMGYYPTGQWLEKFSAIDQGDPLHDRVRRQMIRLREKTSETIVFVRRADTKVVYLDVLESRESIRYATRVGQLLPLHATASGKAILAFYPEPDRRRLLRRTPLVPLTPQTICDSGELSREIDRGIRRGFHVTNGETVENLMGIAACAVLGSEPYALVIGGPLFRVEARAREFGAYLLDACAHVEAS